MDGSNPRPCLNNTTKTSVCEHLVKIRSAVAEYVASKQETRQYSVDEIGERYRLSEPRNRCKTFPPL